MEFLGRSVLEVTKVDDAVLVRLKEFWAMARESAGESTDRSALAAFAWWFPAATLSTEWRVQQLSELLELGVKKPEPSFLVAEALPEVARHAPLQSVQFLRRLLELESERWTVDAWRENIAKVAETALASTGDDEARRVAEETVNWLGALGYRDFRRLIA